jgi:hypothetical protein
MLCRNIKKALQLFDSLLSQKMNNEKEISFNFLLPVTYKNRVKLFKTCVIENLKKMTLKVVPTVRIYDPSFKKRHLTVSLSGTWEQVIKAKSSIIEDLKEMNEEQELILFFSFFNKVIYKSVLQGAVKYIHDHEKLTASNLEAPKRSTPLNFWDVYSSELFLDEDKSSPISKSRRQIFESLSKDQEIILILIRMSENLKNVEQVLNNFQLNTAEKANLFKIFDEVIDLHLKKQRNKNAKYSNSYLNAIENFEIEVKTENHNGTERRNISSRIVELCRTIQERKMFKLFPLSIGTDADEKEWEPEIDSKLSSYLENLQRREIIFGSKSESKQIVSLQPANINTKNDANLMVGSYENHQNILYVIFADSQG